MNKPTETQGNKKMKLYIEELIRNRPFVRSVKKLMKLARKDKTAFKRYDEMTEEEKTKRDSFNKEIYEILDSYEKLRKRCRKLLCDDYTRIQSAIAEEYSIDGSQIQYIKHLLDEKKKGDPDTSTYMEDLAELDMCKIDNLYESELSPLNKSEEIIYLNIQRQLFVTAYPTAICINPRASKRDVLDYINKKWKWIEEDMNSRGEGLKLKYRTRKYGQKLLDFIWENRNLPSKELEAENYSGHI